MIPSVAGPDQSEGETSAGGAVRLKRLELHGFKTFAARVTLEFAPGITCIVGPNGSGKSNVADAVRWVLGEQSTRLLRARRSEDVIFAGGAGRPLMGMAEVALTLDNSARALPVEFSEVVIGRRAFRSGENDYFLNRTRARLRDIADLLSRAGIGQNGHSVVGQGMVDLALSLRPEERRGLFEDAAGVRRFQAKQAEAQTRLAEVRANMNRVADLVAEIEPRVAQLQRQARRAQEEARLRFEWRQAMTSLLAHQRWEIESALAALAAEASQLASRQTAAAAAVSAAAAAAEAVRIDLGAVRQALDDALAERSRLRDAVEQARQELAVLRERHTAAMRLANGLASEVERQQRRRSELERTIPAAERERAAAQAALDAARAAQARAQAALDARRQALEHETVGLAQARREAEEAARLLTQATTRLREADHQLRVVRRQVDEATTGRARAADAVHSTDARLAALDASARAGGERLAAHERERDTVQRVRASVERELNEVQSRLTALDREIQTLVVRLNVLRDVAFGPASDGAAGKAGAAPSGCPAAATPDPPAAPDTTLAQLLRVPAEIEAAVAAAAGAALSWVVVDDPETAAARALEHARTGRRRLTFVSRATLARLPVQETVEVSLLGETAGRLADLVPPDCGLDGLHHALLGNTFLVPDLAAALDLSSRLNGGPRPDLVTPAGEIVNRYGAITAGAPPGEAGVLRRLREMREAEARLAAAQAARDPLARSAAALRRRRDEAQADERRLEAEQRTLQQQLSREEGERRSLVQQRARQAKDLTWWEEFAARATAQETELMDRLKSLEAERRAVQVTQNTAAARLEALSAAAATGEAELAALQDQAAATRTEAAVAEQRLAQASQRVAGAAATVRTAQAELERAQARRSSAQSEVETLDSAVQAAAAVLAEREERLAAAAAGLDMARRRVESLEAQLEAHRRDAEAAQGARTTAERESALLGAKEATLHERLRALHDLAARELGELPPAAASAVQPADLTQQVESLQARLRHLGPVNQVALQEHREASERLRFLRAQLADLEQAGAAIEAAGAELDASVREDFGKTFEAVATHFRTYFRRLFGGGDAYLRLTEPHNLAETGVDIDCQLPGKRRQALALLSGGERALVAAALLFALLKARPSPFYVMDEVDAALDEANVGRFCDVLEELAAETQFVVITHNRATMERAGALYGVTLGEDGVSRVLSVRLSDLPTLSPGAGSGPPARST